MNQHKIPLFAQLIKHMNNQPISFHVPGHKYGALFPEDSKTHFQELLKLDATELTGLDHLHSPEGVILEAEELLAEAYGVKKSFFLVNGSTVGNLAMVMAAVQENDLVLVQRNCHKSVLNGITLSKAHPVFLGPEYDDEWGVAGGVSLQIVQEAIEMYPHAKAIILTYPNYYGMVNELEGIIRIAHDRGIPVLVDEAHGAHFVGGGKFPPSAVQLKADIVVQSAHKTLPAMTMGAYLHVNSDYISEEAINGYLRILQSSSPSYPIMASLDIARHYLATFTADDEEYLLKKIHQFRNELHLIEGMKLLSFKSGLGDPLKITLQSTTSLSGFDLQSLFEKKGIFTELADPYNILLVFPLLKVGMADHLEEVVGKMKDALGSVSFTKQVQRRPIIHQPSISRLNLNWNERTAYKVRSVPLQEAAGEIGAQVIVPYPPGIPILFPGEQITAEVIEYITILLATGARFQGNDHLKKGIIDIYSL